MILAEVKQVRGGHRGDGWMQKLAAKGCLWRGCGRFQRSGIPEPG
jgi:hypothetical protein